MISSPEGEQPVLLAAVLSLAEYSARADRLSAPSWRYR